jgi:hypothetical protein
VPDAYSLDNKRLHSDTFEDQRTVGAPEAEVVFDGHINAHIAGNIGTVIEITLRILIKMLMVGGFFGYAPPGR